MRPIRDLDARQAKDLFGLLFDLDDTLLDHGRLGEPAYSSLFRLRESGLRLFAVTGRPAGWGEVIARQWPIDGAVTENGAISFYPEGRSLRRLDPATDSERRARRIRVAEVVAEISERIPGLRPADDVAQRSSDFTFDIGESQQVPIEIVRQAQAIARERGARTTASSVHLHITVDGDDKASGTLRLLRLLYGIDPTLARVRYAFIGDSENDAACFAAFKTTIAVENFRGRPSVTPRFITENPRGAGFTEAASHLVALRKA